MKHLTIPEGSARGNGRIVALAKRRTRSARFPSWRPLQMQGSCYAPQADTVRPYVEGDWVPYGLCYACRCPRCDHINWFTVPLPIVACRDCGVEYQGERAEFCTWEPSEEAVTACRGAPYEWFKKEKEK